MGYKTKILKVFIKPAVVTQLDIKLEPLSVELQTIEKVGEKVIHENTTDISLERISVKEIEIQLKGVETDIFRSLQYIPGVSTTGDVTAKFYVRGGSGDQNQILFNEVEIDNPFHSLGLFSVIDPDMINSIEFYKGGLQPVLPRVSLDVSMISTTAHGVLFEGGDYFTLDDFNLVKLPDEIKNAVILYQGKLTPTYNYINKYL